MELIYRFSEMPSIPHNYPSEYYRSIFAFNRQYEQVLEEREYYWDFHYDIMGKIHFMNEDIGDYDTYEVEQENNQEKITELNEIGFAGTIYYTLDIKKKEIWIDRIYVKEDYRRKKGATRTIQKIMEFEKIPYKNIVWHSPTKIIQKIIEALDKIYKKNILLKSGIYKINELGNKYNVHFF